ncbi:MAG: rhomboid family intramembrane serine protease [Desulfomonile tiedjei]|nr:rhomboid family intramembrane serine protease [Desulfomonile tiedjei]
MIPLRDSAPSGTVPYVTIAIIIANSVIWLHEVTLGEYVDRFVADYALIPVHVVGFTHFSGGFLHNALLPLFSSAFLHAGWLHIIFNMWFLWIFGDNVEDRLGHFRFVIFYLLCGAGSGLIQVLASPASDVPILGASGAVSGVLGAYLVSFPRARIYTLVIIIILIQFMNIPAWIFLIFWFAIQLLSGAAQLGARQDLGGVAYWAHIGGFVLGILLIWLMAKKPTPRSLSWSGH